MYSGYIDGTVYVHRPQNIFRAIVTPESFKYFLRKVLSSKNICIDQQKRVWHSLDIMQRSGQTWWLLIAKRLHYLPSELIVMIQARIAFNNRLSGRDIFSGDAIYVCDCSDLISRGKELLNSRYRESSIWHAVDILGRSEQTWWLLIAKRQQLLPRELIKEIQQWISCKQK